MIQHRTRMLLAALLLLSSCSEMTPPDFAGKTPTFEPEKFFDGHVVTQGVMENRSGDPVGTFTVDNRGRWTGSELLLEQDIVLDGKPQHRTWHLRRLDEHRYEATGTDIVGLARGEAYGNTFRLEWTLATDPGNSLKNVSMKQWMYLQPDGRTMLNRTTISKLGVILVELTEWFHKEG